MNILSHKGFDVFGLHADNFELVHTLNFAARLTQLQNCSGAFGTDTMQISKLPPTNTVHSDVRRSSSKEYSEITYILEFSSV